MSSLRAVSCALTLAALLLAFIAGPAYAHGGECRWEGGPGAPIFGYCELEDCVGNGGIAICEDPVPVPIGGDPQKGDAKGWQYKSTDLSCNYLVSWRAWCQAAGGVWGGPSSCTGLPDYVIGGGGTLLRIEPPVVPIADGFVSFRRPEICTTDIDDTGWGHTIADANGCMQGAPVYQNGELIRDYRERIYNITQGPECTPAVERVLINRQRALDCPAGYTRRTKPNGDLHCYRLEQNICPVDNPTDPASGAKLLTELDLPATGAGRLELRRFYYNLAHHSSSAGQGNPQPQNSIFWRHNYDYRLSVLPPGGDVLAELSEPGGVVRHFGHDGMEILNRDGKALELGLDHGLWWLHDGTGAFKVFDTNGQLTEIIEPDGRNLSLEYGAQGLTRVYQPADGRELIFSYDANGALETVTRSSGESVSYGYDEFGMLTSATYGDGPSKEYRYHQIKTFFFLDEVIAEDGQLLARYEYFDGGGRLGRVKLAERAGGVNRYEFTYTIQSQGGGITGVFNPLGGYSTIVYLPKGGVRKVTDYNGQCSYCGGTTRRYFYDADGNVNRSVDFNGWATDYSRNSRNLVINQREALGSSFQDTVDTRAIQTDWHPDFRLPIERRVHKANGTLESRETWTYNTRGQVLSRSEIDPATSATRTWTYSYCEQADVDAPGSTCPVLGYRKAIDGPRSDVSDVTTFTYHPTTDESGCDTGGPCHRRGDLWTVTNALGHVSEHLRYDRAGRVTRVRDANGVLTDLSYHPRGWLAQRIVRTRADGIADALDAITSFAYTPTGLIERITQPDGDYVDYSYDNAQRLIGIADALGNHIVYTLDPAGNRIAEETFDPGNTLRRRLAREYNTLSRVIAERDAIIDATHPNGRLVAEHLYDNNGNRTRTTDGLGRRTDHEYDRLNRLKKSLDALNPRGIVEYAYLCSCQPQSGLGGDRVKGASAA